MKKTDRENDRVKERVRERDYLFCDPGWFVDPNFFRPCVVG